MRQNNKLTPSLNYVSLSEWDNSYFSVVTNHLRLHDSWVRVKEFLDFSRVDVLSTSDDHVLHSSHDLSIPVLINDGNIPGMKPSISCDNLDQYYSKGSSLKISVDQQVVKAILL